jgi:hypothetical protein
VRALSDSEVLWNSTQGGGNQRETRYYTQERRMKKKKKGKNAKTPAERNPSSI